MSSAPARPIRQRAGTAPAPAPPLSAAKRRPTPTAFAASAIPSAGPSLSPSAGLGRRPPPAAARGPAPLQAKQKAGASAAAAPATPAAQLTGAIVAFLKDGQQQQQQQQQPQFGVVLGPDGKAKLSVSVAPRGNRVSLAPKALSLAVLGSYKASDLDAMLPAQSEQEDGQEEDEDLALGWEVALDEHGAGNPAPLPVLAELLLGASGPKELVRAYRLLSDPRAGGRYFVSAKAVAAAGSSLVPTPAFAARTAEAVAAARLAAEAEAAVRREEAAFVSAMRAEMDGAAERRRRARREGGQGDAHAGSREAWARWLGGGGGGGGSSSGDQGGEHAEAFAARVRALRALALWAPTGEAPRDSQQQSRDQQQQPMSAAALALALAGPPLPPPPRGLAAFEDDMSPALPLGVAASGGGGGGGGDASLFPQALLDLGRSTVALFGAGGGGGGSASGGGGPAPATAAAAAAAATPTTTATAPSSDLQALAAASNAAWRLLVDAGLARSHEPRPLLAAGVDPRRPFPPALVAAAASISAAASSLPDRHASSRLSFGGAEVGGRGGGAGAGGSSSARLLRVFAVDDADTNDVDDALSVEIIGGGGGGGGGGGDGAGGAGTDAALRIWVHVADPTRWLLPAALLGEGEDVSSSTPITGPQRLIELSRVLLQSTESAGSSGSNGSGGGGASSLRAAARSLLAEARRRTRSLYLPFGSVPMFPEILSAGLFSLVPSADALLLASAAGPEAEAAVAARDRCALSFGATLEAGTGRVVEGSVQIVPSIVRVTDRMTYDEADAALAVGAAAAFAGDGSGGSLGGGLGGNGGGGCDGSSSSVELQDRDAALQLLYAASRRRREWRDSCAAITIDTPECKLVVREEELDLPGGGGGSAGGGGGGGSNGASPPPGAASAATAGAPSPSATRLSQWESAARQMIAEAMILAGAAAGAAGAARGLPLPFRAQPQPPDLPSPAELDALPPGPCRGYALRRKMTRSSFASRPAPHAALGLAEYVQVTSPIRRYSDLLAHAALKEVGGDEGGGGGAGAAAAAGGDEGCGGGGGGALFEAGALTASLGEQAASSEPLGRAERSVERYWAAEWARLRRAADEPLEASVLGWAGRGGGGGGGGGGGLVSLSLESSGLEAVARVWWDAKPGERVQALVEESRPARGGFFRLSVTGPVGGGGEVGGGQLVETVRGGGRGVQDAVARGFLDEDEYEDEDEDEEVGEGEEEDEAAQG